MGNAFEDQCLRKFEEHVLALHVLRKRDAFL